jgi:tetratricopeptide (TPR) repeat protein
MGLALCIAIFIPIKEVGGPGRSSIVSRLASRVATVKNLNQAAYTQRFLMWSAAWDMFKDHPVAGVGWGNYELLYPYYQAKYVKIPRYSTYRTHSNNAHNELLEIITQVGILGLGIYLWLFFVFFKSAFQIYRKAEKEKDRVLVLGLAAGIIGMFVDNMLNVSMHFPMPAMPFWINIGAIFVIGNNCIPSGKYRIKTGKNKLPAGAVCITAFAALVIILNVKYFMGEVYYFKGFKSARLGNLEMSAQECLKSWEQFKLNVDNNYELGNAYARLAAKAVAEDDSKRYRQKAEWAYSEAIRANPGYDEIYFNLGVIYAQLEKFDESLKMMNESIRINPIFHDSYLNLGNIYIQKKMWKEAIGAFRQCIILKQDNPTAQQNLSYALTQAFEKGQEYIDAKKWDEAEKLYSGVVEAFPEDIKAHLYLGNIFYTLKKFKSATEEYKKVLEISPKKDINVMNNLGMAYLDAGEKDLARDTFLEVLAIDPSNYAARRKLAETGEKK